MFDSLLILSMTFAPVARPNMERVSVVKVPTVQVVAMVRKDEQEPEKATTCYLATVNGCWTEGN